MLLIFYQLFSSSNHSISVSAAPLPFFLFICTIYSFCFFISKFSIFESTMASSDLKLLRKPSFVMERKPLMLLKDFLRDDFSSCSSNGFKSFPRRQCCTTTVRYLLDRDLCRARDSAIASRRLLKRSRSKAAASTTISALQKASEVVLNAVKHLPFTSVKSRSSMSSKGGYLPRSLSRKLLKRSFWKKGGENGDRQGIGRWRSFREFLEEKEPTSDSITVTTVTTATTTTTTTATTTASSSNSNSWSGSEFTSDYLQSSSCTNSVCFGKNDVVGDNNKLPEKNDGVRVGVEVGEDSMEEASSTTTKKEWPIEEEKEQFSPVSVLDCPFDDEEEICSPFTHRLVQMEGKKHKLMPNIRRFECLAQLEPMDLEKRIALSHVDHNELLTSPNQCGSASTNNNTTLEFEKLEKEIETEEKAKEVLYITKTRVPAVSLKYKSDKLFLDFFRDRIEKKIVQSGGGCDELNQEQLLKVAEDWANGKPHEVLLDWQVQDGREAYIRDMEEGGEWRKLDEQKEEVGLEVEVGVWTCLVNELVLDIFLR